LTRRKAAQSAISGSGHLVSRIKSVEGFTQVDVSNAFKVSISHGSRQSVSITADDNVMELIEVERRGDTLSIGLQAGDYEKVTLEGKIEMPELKGLQFSGATRGTISGFSSANELSVGLSGASILEGDLEGKHADLRLSGASRVKLSGTVERLLINGSGASGFDLAAFTVARAEVSLSGASRATVKATQSLDGVTLSGASVLSYLGHPEIKEVSTSGASTVERVT